MGPILIVALAVLVLLVGGVVIVVAVLVARQRSAPPQMLAGPVQPSFASLGLDATRAWQAAGPSLVALGMRQLDAETYMLGIGGGQDMFLTLRVADMSLSAWLDRPCPGCVLEQYLGTKAEINPGEAGRSDLQRLMAGSVREVLAALPRAAEFSVKAPEIPGDSYKARVSTPFSAVDQPSIFARVLLTFDETAKSPAVGGSHVRLPPAVLAWQAAGQGLTALGLSKLDAETYMRTLDGGQMLFVSLSVRESSLRGWFDRPCPGGALEQFLGGRGDVSPGHGGSSPLERLVAANVQEALSALPRSASLTVQAPEIPGDSYKASLTTPFSTPDQAASVARVLLTLDAFAQRPAAGGGHAHLPPVVMAWQAAAQGLAAVGMTRLDAETYMRNLDGGQSLYLSLSVRDATIRGWLDRPCPGGILERYLRAEVDLQPGDGGRSELAAWVARGVHESLGALPRAARA